MFSGDDAQINFDLLGELIKFNKTLFRELNTILAGDKFDQFVEVCFMSSKYLDHCIQILSKFEFVIPEVQK